MEQVGGSQACCAISRALLVHQQRKRDTRLFAKRAGIGLVSEPNRGQARALLQESLFVIAQLRDILTAEDSSVMAQEDDDRGVLFP